METEGQTVKSFHAWCVVPFDERQRGPGERAKMLREIGIRRFAYDWRDQDIDSFEEEIIAIREEGIDLIAWWWSFSDRPKLLESTLQLFARHGIAPRFWVMQDRNIGAPNELSDAEHAAYVEAEARRIVGISQAVERAGCGVDLYGHNDWFGVPANQIAVVDRARELGARDLGIVYNFSHAVDDWHDDRVDFEGLWGRLAPYVRWVNLAGVHYEDGTTLLPGDGAGEKMMLSTIQQSQWTGGLGVIAESGGDARTTLLTAIERAESLFAPPR